MGSPTTAGPSPHVGDERRCSDTEAAAPAHFGDRTRDYGADQPEEQPTPAAGGQSAANGFAAVAKPPRFDITCEGNRVQQPLSIRRYSRRFVRNAAPPEAAYRFLTGTFQGVNMSDPGWYPPIEGAHWRPAEDFPTSPVEPEPAPAKANRNWVVPAALAVGAAGVASAVTLGVVLWPRQETAPAPPTITGSPAPPPAPTTSAPQPAEAVAEAVQSSMQEDLDDDPDLPSLKVTKVRLVHKSGNEYKGIATVRTSDGESHDVPVDVTADDDNLLWETPPGAFASRTTSPHHPHPRSGPRHHHRRPHRQPLSRISSSAHRG